MKFLLGIFILTIIAFLIVLAFHLTGFVISKIFHKKWDKVDMFISGVLSWSCVVLGVILAYLANMIGIAVYNFILS